MRSVTVGKTVPGMAWFFLMVLFPACFVLVSCGERGEDTAEKGYHTESVSLVEESGNVESENAAGENGNTEAGVSAEAAAYIMESYGLEHLAEAPKVILDCDMTFLGDDAMAMCILAQADGLGLVELLGVTITGGNTCVAAGTNAALRQLELIGRSDIPVYMGTDEPIDGFRDIFAQEKVVGKIQHWGLPYEMEDYVEPSKYHELGVFYDRDWGYSETEPQRQSSVDFMVEQVHKYPGQVTIISIGAPTNIALACLETESFASDAAGIIYMGTVLQGPGTYTPFADFNCFYDAKAFEICFQSAFRSQIVVPHDVAGDAMLNKAVFDMLEAKNRTAASSLWLERKYSLYRRDTARKDTCTDAIAAAVFLNPSLSKDKAEHKITINTDVEDEKYGSITLYDSADENPDAAKAVFVLEINTDEYWDFVTDVLSHAQEETQ